MTREILLLALVLGGCDEPARRADPAAGSRPGARYAIFLNGTKADDGKRQRCAEEVQAAGGVIDPTAPVRAVLTLEEYGNKLEIVSQARGIVQNVDLPKWDMRRLCREALAALAPAIAQEPPPGYRQAPPPGYAPQRPIPSVRLVAAPVAPPSVLPPDPGAPKAVVELASRGAQSYARGDFPNALVNYAEANRQASSPALLFDLGLCYQGLNRPTQALQYFQLFVDRAPAAPQRADAERMLGELRRQLGDTEE